MKKLRLFLATVMLASAFVVAGAAPASASCIREPVDPCGTACAIGYSNPRTRPFFLWCTIV